MKNVQKGETAYIVISNRIIEPVTILSVSGEFCTVHFTSRQGGTRLRKSRVFARKEEATASIKSAQRKTEQESDCKRWL